MKVLSEVKTCLRAASDWGICRKQRWTWKTFFIRGLWPRSEVSCVWGGRTNQDVIKMQNVTCLCRLSVTAATLNPMMKMLSVSSTVRQTSVDTLASSRHWLLTSASVWEYTAQKAQLQGRCQKICLYWSSKYVFHGNTTCLIRLLISTKHVCSARLWTEISPVIVIAALPGCQQRSVKDTDV